MRYITNADNCLVSVSFGADIECAWGVCREYTGAVPSGYSSLEDWYTEEAEKLCRWKVVSGNLTLVAGAVVPKDPNIFDLIYPAGSVYMSVSPVYPGDLFGGTWEQIQNTSLPWAYMWKRVDGSGGEGCLIITDDGAGNVIIQTQGAASIVDDGAGNVTIVNSGSTSITDDGAGNVTIF